MLPVLVRLEHQTQRHEVPVSSFDVSPPLEARVHCLKGHSKPCRDLWNLILCGGQRQGATLSPRATGSIARLMPKEGHGFEARRLGNHSSTLDLSAKNRTI